MARPDLRRLSSSSLLPGEKQVFEAILPLEEREHEET